MQKTDAATYAHVVVALKGAGYMHDYSLCHTRRIHPKGNRYSLKNARVMARAFLSSFLHLILSRHEAERILIIRLECMLRVTVPTSNNYRFVAAYEFY